MRTCVNYHSVAKNKHPQSISKFNSQMRVQLTSGTSANWRNNIVSIRAVRPEQTQKNETVLLGQTINQSRGSQRDVGGVHARCERNHQDAAPPTNSASRGRSSDAAGRERFRGDGQWGGWGEGWNFAPGQGQPQERSHQVVCARERTHARSLVLWSAAKGFKWQGEGKIRTMMAAMQVRHGVRRRPALRTRASHDAAGAWTAAARFEANGERN